nr:immunoglobulin heavy chain junction region [Macaca mulatta]MOV36246.1 immunoglobulin heavy chain junction region [Macaca mulatta]
CIRGGPVYMVVEMSADRFDVW